MLHVLYKALQEKGFSGIRAESSGDLQTGAPPIGGASGVPNEAPGRQRAHRSINRASNVSR